MAYGGADQSRKDTAGTVQLHSPILRDRQETRLTIAIV